MTERQSAARPTGSTAAGHDTDRIQPPLPPTPQPQHPQHAQPPQHAQSQAQAQQADVRAARTDVRPDSRPDDRTDVRTDGRQQRPAVPEAAGALLAGQDLEAVTRRWHDIQAGFVDAPQQAVKDADALVADLLDRLTQMFTAERRQLESQWSRGDEVSTEDLRVSLQRYRTFFQRLLSVH